jgi:hypothetical protein
MKLQTLKFWLCWKTIVSTKFRTLFTWELFPIIMLYNWTIEIQSLYNLTSTVTMLLAVFFPQLVVTSSQKFTAIFPCL